VERVIYALAFGVLVFAMHAPGEPTHTALAWAAAAVLYAALVGGTAWIVNAVPFARPAWRAALILIAGTGFATFLFPLAPLAILLGIAFAGLELARRLAPARLAPRDAA
jgi:hypothetical protein